LLNGSSATPGLIVEALMLLRGVREVAAVANPAQPGAVTQRTFDATKADSDHAHLPAARQIARELGMPWRVVVAVANEPTGRQNHLLGLAGRVVLPADSVTDERVAFALRLVAGRLGAATLTTGAYEAERLVLLADDRRDWLHGRRLRLPSAAAIRLAAGGWDAALTLAELATDERPPQAIKQTILSRLDVMDRFHEHYAEQPTQRALLAFARGNGIPMSDEKRRPWSETVAEWRQRRRARGLPEPPASSRRGGRGMRAPDYSADVGAARPDERPHRGKWRDGEECATWVARYLANLPAGERSTRAGYGRWASLHPGAPSASRLAQHGGWEAVRLAAAGITVNWANARACRGNHPCSCER
jgi:hypothetical protein